MYFFTGENGFAVREERRKWKEQFVEKHGAENCSSLDGKGLRVRDILDEISTAPFIAPKRLVIINGVPKLTKEDMDVLMEAQHPDCILLFVDPTPDKRLGGVKVLLKIATLKECPPLRGRQLTEWLNRMAAAENTSLTPDAADELVRIVGEDQEMLFQEIRKASSYAVGRSITKKDIQALAVPSGDQEIWHLTNLICQGNRSEALLFAQALLARGEDPYGLWSILLWMLRGIVCVTSAVSEGQRNPATIASSFSLPFPTVKNVLGLAGKVKVAALEDTVRWAAGSDIDLKTGGYRATADAPQELVALIDMLIVRCTKLAA